MNTPLVSVVIPVYNQERFLSDTLQSVLQQSYSHLEVIIVDDGSTDQTPQLCERWRSQDSRIHLFHQTNQGPAQARNHGVQQAQGEYICLLDGDDLMDPRRIELQLQALRQHPTASVVYTAVQTIDEKGQYQQIISGHTLSPNDFLALMFFRNQVPGPGIMAKAECFRLHPYQADFRHAEDYEWMLRLAHHYQFVYLDLPLTLYRRHTHNLSNNLPAHHASELRIWRSYGLPHIEKIVDQSSFPAEEKTLLKGKIAFIMELYEPALAYFQACPSSSLAHFYRGNCYSKLHRLEDAAQALETALRLDPANAAGYNNLGCIRALLGHSALAESLFNQAKKLKPGYLDAEYNHHHYSSTTYQPRFTWRELRASLLTYT